MATETYGTVTYGNTWAAVTHAIAAAIGGSSSAIVFPQKHIGGCVTSGLSNIDLGRYGTRGIGWLTQETFRRVTQATGYRSQLTRVYPSLMEQVLMEMLRFYGVYVRSGFQLDYTNASNISMTGTTLNSFTTTDGTTFAATNFGDCTEEGDLAAVCMPGSMVVGRDSQSLYNETLAGFYPVPDSFVPFDCYVSNTTTPINGITAYPNTVVGAGDAGVQCYSYRVCWTADTYNQRAWPKPAGYDPTLFEFQRRRMVAATDPSVFFPITGSACLAGKFDANGDFGTNLQWQWPNASPVQRATITQQIFNEQFGWYWFTANDTSVPAVIRDYMNSIGPPVDEFQDSSITPAGVPYEVYVRTGRRLKDAQYVMTQADATTTVTKTDNVSMDFYSFDCHINQRLATIQNGVPGYILDGLNAVADTSFRQVVPYQRPLRCGLPLTSKLVNMTVPVACGSSAVANYSLRIDLAKANFAAALGYLCGRSVATSTPINSYSVSSLQADLDSFGQVRAYTPP